MISFRRPPSLIPTTPRSQPGITLAGPKCELERGLAGVVVRAQDDRIASRCRTGHPSYRTETTSPVLARRPLPTIRSSSHELVRRAALTLGTFGLVWMSASPADGVTFVAFGAGVGGYRGVVSVCVSVCVWSASASRSALALECRSSCSVPTPGRGQRQRAPASTDDESDGFTKRDILAISVAGRVVNDRAVDQPFHRSAVVGIDGPPQARGASRAAVRPGEAPQRPR